MPWHLALPLAQANEAAQNAAAAVNGSLPLAALFGIVGAIIAASFLGGIWLARALRMPDQGWRFFVVLFVLLAGTAVVATGYRNIKLGIDLRGGVNWVYEVDTASLEEGETVDMDQLIAAIVERVNPGGQREVTVRPYGVNQIEIILPEVDREEIERFEVKTTSLGTLGFRILANDNDHGDLLKAAKLLPASQDELEIDGQLKARWVPIDNDPAVLQEFADEFTADGRTNARGERQLLVVMDQFNVTGEFLESTRPGTDRQLRPCVEFTFNARGANLFAGLTSLNVPDPATGLERRLSVLLDGFLKTAPTIQSTISDRGEISGADFNEEKVNDLVGVLNAGSLPTALNKTPISRVFTGPTLGQDTIARAKIALTAAVVITMLFMIVYYRFAGVLASLAVLGNLVLTVAVVIAIQAPLTLPGLAGLALTLGMAVDANVLIYERMREELARGATLRMAIRNGYARAMSAIIDSNLTTLITATVLYWIGTEQIKGFAVMLWVGIVISMFTAIFCSRLAFDVFEKMRWLKKLKMMQFIGETHFNFIGWWRPAAIASLAIIAIGLAGMANRGQGMLGIEFTGGSSVTVLFQGELPIATVREKVNQDPEDFTDVTVTDVQETGEPNNLRFKIETSNQDPVAVEGRLAGIFGQELATVGMEIGEVTAIAAADEADAVGEEAAEGEEAQPDEAEGAALSPPSQRLLAAAGDNQQALLAFAQNPDVEAEAEDAADAGADTDDVADDAASDNPATDEAPAAETDAPEAADEAAADQPAIRAEVDDDTTLEELLTPDADANAPDDAAILPDSALRPDAAKDLFAGGSEAKLTFVVNAPVPAGQQKRSAPISYETLHDVFKLALTEAGKENVAYLLENPYYVKGSAATFDNWTAKLALPVAEARPLLEQIRQHLASKPYFPSSSKIGSAVAGNTRNQALLALIASIVFIVLYLWVRFQKVMYGVAAVVALLHDVLVTLAFLAVSYYIVQFVPFLANVLLIDPFKIDLTVMAAVLTIIGYSLNDTIVVFDRIREVRGKSPDLTVAMVNLSVNQTLSRTILTGLTTMAVVLVLYVWGGKSIHGFAYTLFVGLLVGTYSSIYVAAPVLLWASGYRKSAVKAGASREQAAAPATALSKSARG